MLKVIIFFHSAVDVITNSSTELFCEVTSEHHLSFIKGILEQTFGREVDIYPSPEEVLQYPENYKTNIPCIQFSIEYIDDHSITDDFCSLLDAYLTSLIGKGNFKINKDVSY